MYTWILPLSLVTFADAGPVPRIIRPVLSFHEVSHQREKHALGYTIQSKSYRSDPMPLAGGEVVFTDPMTTFLTFPNDTEYAITKFSAEVVDDNGTSVPLDEVYNHHWLIFNSNKHNQGVCGGFLNYNFGVGAEGRTTPVEYPEGYGYVFAGKDRWTANIHLLRTQGLAVTTNATQAVKECIECWYAPIKGCSESASGTFDCCQDGSTCPVAPDEQPPAKNYYLKYTLSYTTDVSNIKPVHVFLLDASNCKIEYNIQANTVQPYLETKYTWSAPITGTAILGIGHIHNAGVNVTLYVNDKAICTSFPKYGTEPGVAGNEKGYLVHISGCELDMVVNAGDEVKVQSWYYVGYDDPTGSGFEGGFHGGVMSYMYLAFSAETLRDRTGNAIADPTHVVWGSTSEDVHV